MATTRHFKNILCLVNFLVFDMFSFCGFANLLCSKALLLQFNNNLNAVFCVKCLHKIICFLLLPTVTPLHPWERCTVV